MSKQKSIPSSPVVRENGLLTLTEASKLLPTTNGKKIATETLWRWTQKGCCGVVLKHYRFGRRISTTLPDLLAFGEAVAAARAANSVGGE
jgi:hypothetical protein